jgi:hypothetical protein
MYQGNYFGAWPGAGYRGYGLDILHMTGNKDILRDYIRLKSNESIIISNGD